LVLVLLLIFILQNTRSVKVTYFTVSGTIPVGVALLFAAMVACWSGGLAPYLATSSPTHPKGEVGLSMWPPGFSDHDRYLMDDAGTPWGSIACHRLDWVMQNIRSHSEQFVTSSTRGVAQ